MTPAQARELREEILPAIDRARQALVESKEREDFSDMANVAAAAGHGISTWHAWRRKNEPTSPKFFDLRDFARAVGLNVGAPCYDTGVQRGEGSASRDGDPLKPETRDVMRVMEDGSDELRAAIKARMMDLLTERASHPPTADAEQVGPRARFK